MDKVIAQQYSVCLTCMILWIQSSVLHTKKVKKKKRMGAFYVIIAKEALVIDTTTN